jgi:hypothetical protein
MNLAGAPRRQQRIDALPRLREQQRGEATRDVVKNEAERMCAETRRQLLL